jgi:Carboxypeptidase regulatory-like domain
MFVRTSLTLVLFAAGTIAADPKSPTPADLDKIAVDVLKDLHDRGADLYNAADAAGAQRLYEGALRTVSPFLAHRPAVQKVIADGLAEIAKADGVKVRAFRLHELIERVRADLKPDDKKPELPAVGKLAGLVTVNGKPLAGCSVTIVSLDLPQPRVFTAVTNADGRYTFPDPIPTGKYVVMVTDGGAVKLPAKYQSTMTSDLSAVVSGNDSTANLELQSN